MYLYIRIVFLQAQSLPLRKKVQGALPVVGPFLQAVGWSQPLARPIPHPPAVAALDLLVQSVLLQPGALCRIEAWAQTCAPLWRPTQHRGDDALGRALDRLFETDRARLHTGLILQAVQVFKVQTDPIHHDSTSVKYQPHLEKRRFLCKSVLEISPVFLKNNDRIEALMFICFVAQRGAALMERAVRQNMARRGIKALPILPEGRHSQTPSGTQILEAFAPRAKEELYEKDHLIQVFINPRTELQQTWLQLLEIDAAVYRQIGCLTNGFQNGHPRTAECRGL